jgi:hypothetical protein
MRFDDIYRMAIEMGIEADPRSREDIQRILDEVRESSEKLEGRKKEIFDEDNLWNPYADSRILVGEGDREVQSAMVGIDITPGKVVLADRLREHGEVDCIIGHHPQGRAGANFYEVMHMQENMLEEMGIGITVAEGIFQPRIHEVMRAVHPRNYNQSVDACRLLDMPFMCLHSPADNHVQNFLEKLFKEKGPEKIKDLIEVLEEIPEFDISARDNAGPKVFVGDKERRVGEIVVKMTGGTSGPKEVYENLSNAGVGTVVCMHIPEKHIEEAKKNHINVVVSGHMASDSLGLNLIMDRIEERGVRMVPCSGFIRVKRN